MKKIVFVIGLTAILASCQTPVSQKDSKTDSTTEVKIDTTSGTKVDTLKVDSVKGVN